MYESKGTLFWTDVGIDQVWSQTITELLNNETVFYAQTTKVPANSLEHKFVSRYARNPAVGPVKSVDALVGDSVGRLENTHKLKQYRAAISIEDARVLEAKKNGIGPLKDAFAAEFVDTMKDLAKDLNEAFYADSQTEGFATGDIANPVDGLRGILKTTGEIYGNDRSSYSILQAKVDTTTTVWTHAAFRTWVSELVTNGAKKGDLVVYTTPAIEAIILNKMENNKLYMGVSSQAGFEGALTIDGIPIIADSDAPADHIFILDRSSYYIAEFTPFSMVDEGKLATNNLTTTKAVWGHLDLVFRRFNTSYKITGITE